jgi:hypothetical protein
MKNIGERWLRRREQRDLGRVAQLDYLAACTQLIYSRTQTVTVQNSRYLQHTRLHTHTGLFTLTSFAEKVQIGRCRQLPFAAGDSSFHSHKTTFVLKPASLMGVGA